MRNYIYKITSLLLIIILVTSCGNKKQSEDSKRLAEKKAFTEKDKQLLDELEKLRPVNKLAEQEQKQRGKLKMGGIATTDPLLFFRKMILEETKGEIEEQAQTIKNLKLQIKDIDTGNYTGYRTKTKEDLERDLQYEEKLLELLKLRKEYLEHSIQAAEKEK
ncbi:hypothetical protein [Candidatus Amoebophilus asiaticus]|uniref:hypothetical protein n=1 Tax=Candidatus Amoebophilus asiaticus TaxID=281120 RepID=UPI0001715D42|nr:hypothetical protein [Candidatus Amoebophilus asiaticus]